MNEEKQQISKSPSPIIKESLQTEVKKMDFYDALKEIANDKKVHKLEWKDLEFYILLKDGILSIHKPDGKFYQLVLSDGDINGTDWIICE